MSQATVGTWANPKPINTDDLMLAFGPSNIDQFLPPEGEIPSEFMRHSGPWVKMAERWFYEGLPKETPIEAKDGIDSRAAVRHISACLRSFEPSHERKIGGVAFLLHAWFKQFGDAK